MVSYTFYTNEMKTNDSLMVRTQEGWMRPDDAQSSDILLFEDKHKAQRDFMALMFDNEEFRIGTYIGAEPEKKAKAKKAVPQKEKAIAPVKHYMSLPEGFELEINKVHNIDCVLFMKQLPTGYVDYIFTSPPYNAGKRTSHGKNNAIYKDDENMYNMYEDELGDKEYEDWLFGIIEDGLRVCKYHMFMNIQMLGKNKRTIMKIFHVFGDRIKDIIIWNKTIASPHIVPGIMNSAFEFIFIFSNISPEKRNFDDGNFKGNFRNVITGVNASQNEYRHLNKATFPLYLPRTIIQKFGKDGDIWFDMFSGTGTTFHACALENREFVGTEIDAEQCLETNKRVQAERNKLKLNFG